MNPWWGVCFWQIDRSSFRVQPSAKTWHGTVAAHITRPWNTTIVGHPTQRETLSFDLRDAPPDNDITEFTSVSGMSRRKISLRPLNYETGTRLCVLLCEGRIDFIDGNRGVSYQKGSIANFPSQLPLIFDGICFWSSIFPFIEILIEFVISTLYCIVCRYFCVDNFLQLIAKIFIWFIKIESKLQ